MGIIVHEAESRTSLLIFIVWLYRILESAGLPNDRHGAVAKAHQLA